MRLTAGIWTVTLAGARRHNAPICNRSFTKPLYAHVNPTGGCLGRLPGPRRNTTRPAESHDCRFAKKLAQHGPSSDISAKKFAQQRAPSCSTATKFARRGAFMGSTAKNFAQRSPSSGVFAKKFAQHATKRQFWAIFRAQGELFRAHSHHQTEQGELFRAQDTAAWQL